MLRQPISTQTCLSLTNYITASSLTVTRCHVSPWLRPGSGCVRAATDSVTRLHCTCVTKTPSHLCHCNAVSTQRPTAWTNASFIGCHKLGSSSVRVSMCLCVHVSVCPCVVSQQSVSSLSEVSQQSFSISSLYVICDAIEDTRVIWEPTAYTQFGLVPTHWSPPTTRLLFMTVFSFL